MTGFATLADTREIQAEMPWDQRPLPRTIYGLLGKTAGAYGQRPAISFQITSGQNDKAETLSWADFHAKVTQAANLFRSLGIGESDVVAYVLPNCNETAITLIGGTVAGIAAPINPLLEPAQMAAILNEVGAKVVVTLKAFPKTDVAQKVAEALMDAPAVETVLEVDLNRYLTPPKSWIVPLVRPKNPAAHSANALSFNAELSNQATELAFDDATEDRVAAYFHTGGTTGMPKVAQHQLSGMIYNGWLGEQLLFSPEDNVMCPLPLFHVFACHVILMAMIASGAHVIFPTPAGYRGDGVFDNFWKLIERWKVTFIIAVPTAISALMQRPVDADISSIKNAFSGSSPLPIELFRRFEEATKVAIYEGYGLTEATCLVSINPPDGIKKIGSVGIPFPYCDVRILNCDAAGTITKECGVDEVGEICVSNPGVMAGHTYTDDSKNVGLFADDRYLLTGDLGRIDGDGYLFITGRAKDLIIRGGHNIDPALIEEALAGHPAVAMVGAIGQPDAHAGELPAAYVELVAEAEVSEQELMDYAVENVGERAAHPKHVEILDELPKTAVGKVFKPALRRLAITRIFNAALAEAGHEARVKEVVEHKKHGLIARLEETGKVSRDDVAKLLGKFTYRHDWQ